MNRNEKEKKKKHPQKGKHLFLENNKRTIQTYE